MKRGLYVVPIVLTLVASWLAPKGALAGDRVGVHVLETAEEKVLRITVHPAAEVRPALKYQLLPGFLERKPGNAAVHYGKVTAEQSRFFGDRERLEKIAKWASTPLDELPLDEMREALEVSTIFETIGRAARSEYCDWQLPLREGNFYTILIPEIQQIRAFARLLAAKARLQIAEGQFDEAIETLRVGYAVGQHAAEGQTLVHGLVGIAISNIMSYQLVDLLQQPDAPNLYWALTSLPRPLIGVKSGIEAEMYSVHLTFPELRDLDDASRSPEYWRDALHSCWKKLMLLNGGMDDAARPEVVTMLAIRGYPMARQALIEQGRSPEEVDAMPVPRVVLFYTKQTFEELRDDFFKWFYVPYWESREGVDKADQQLRRCRQEFREIVPMATMLLPAINAVSAAIARTEREINVLRTIEALRMYAAANDGRLPEKLSDLPVPVPIDPLTGQPFAYQLRGDTAVITGPPAPGILLHLEIKVAR